MGNTGFFASDQFRNLYLNYDAAEIAKAMRKHPLPRGSDLKMAWNAAILSYLKDLLSYLKELYLRVDGLDDENVAEAIFIYRDAADAVSLLDIQAEDKITKDVVDEAKLVFDDIMNNLRRFADKFPREVRRVFYKRDKLFQSDELVTSVFVSSEGYKFYVGVHREAGQDIWRPFIRYEGGVHPSAYVISTHSIKAGVLSSKRTTIEAGILTDAETGFWGLEVIWRIPKYYKDFMWEIKIEADGPKFGKVFRSYIERPGAIRQGLHYFVPVKSDDIFDLRPSEENQDIMENREMLPAPKRWFVGKYGAIYAEFDRGVKNVLIRHPEHPTVVVPIEEGQLILIATAGWISESECSSGTDRQLEG